MSIMRATLGTAAQRRQPLAGHDPGTVCRHLSAACGRHGEYMVSDGRTGSFPGRTGSGEGRRGHVDILLAWESRRKAASAWKSASAANDGDQLPQQGTYVFVLSRPDLEERIELNAENGYRQRVEFLERRRYVLDEQGEGTVTYRIDGGSERTLHASGRGSGRSPRGDRDQP